MHPVLAVHTAQSISLLDLSPIVKENPTKNSKRVQGVAVSTKTVKKKIQFLHFGFAVR